MNNVAKTFIDFGRQYQAAFEDAHVLSMPIEKKSAYEQWIIENPEYEPTFSVRLGAAVLWAERNEDEFEDILGDFDASIGYVNEIDTDEIDPLYFANIAEVRSAQPDVLLPTIFGNTLCVDDPDIINRTTVDAAHRLRWGETIQPDDGDWYSWHAFITTDKGMVGASMLDLYEIFTKTSGHYPLTSGRDAVVAAAITEAAYITGPDSSLFRAINDPVDQWIEGYPAFTPAFQQLARNA